MKVLLVEREEPFSLFGVVAEAEGADARGSAGGSEDAGLPENVAAMFSPLLSVEMATGLPAFSGWSAGYDACVLPGALFLERGAFSIPIPSIVYGSGDLALPCFAAGAVDFMREGWSMLELEARLYRLAQPTIACAEGVLALRGFRLIWKGFAAGESEAAVALSAMETEMLRAFMATPGRIVAPESLRGNPWAHPGEGKTRAFDMRVSRLKAKLSRLHPGLGGSIRSSRGLGYLWITS